MSIQVGIVGTGRIAQNRLAPALSEVSGARLWSVLSRDAERAAAFAAEHGAAGGGYASEAEFLADPQLDAVIIATPDALHAEQAVAAARAGKHVLLEKPMATTRDGAQQIVSACEQAGVQLGVAYHLRWHAGHRKLAAMLHASELGKPHYARALWTWQAADNSNWRAHPELGRWWSLAGVGTHCVDLLRWMLTPVCGEQSAQAALIDRSRYRGPHDETACLSMQFGGGALADVVTSVMFAATSRFDLYTSNAEILCEGTLGATGSSDGSIRINGEPLPFDSANPYVGEIQNFVDAINGAAPIEVPGSEGMRNVEILLDAL